MGLRPGLVREIRRQLAVLGASELPERWERHEFEHATFYEMIHQIGLDSPLQAAEPVLVSTEEEVISIERCNHV